MGKSPFYYDKNSRVYLKGGVYPYNVMRNIGIDSISTTHFLLTDIDVLPSTNLYKSIMRQPDLLRNPDNVILFQLFQFTNTPANQCITSKCNIQL